MHLAVGDGHTVPAGTYRAAELVSCGHLGPQHSERGRSRSRTLPSCAAGSRVGVESSSRQVVYVATGPGGTHPALLSHVWASACSVLSSKAMDDGFQRTVVPLTGTDHREPESARVPGPSAPTAGQPSRTRRPSSSCATNCTSSTTSPTQIRFLQVRPTHPAGDPLILHAAHDKRRGQLMCRPRLAEVTDPVPHPSNDFAGTITAIASLLYP